MILVYGTVCLDIFQAVDARGAPLPGSEGAHRVLPGGEAFNTAIALAGWKVPVLLTGTALGLDAESDQLRALLDDPAWEALDRTLLPDRVPDAVTSVCTVRVFPDGERQMSGRGYAQAVAPPPLSRALLARCPVVAIDPNLGPAATQTALDAAGTGCALVAMDFEHELEVVRACRILVTSHERLLRKVEKGHTFDPRDIARRLMEEGGAPTAIVTLGTDGCVVADRNEGLWDALAVRPPHPIVDTTGAGDTFRAGLCYGLLQRWPLRQTVQFASAAAALHCCVWGGGSRIPLAQVLETAELAGGAAV